ncbi:MAG: substrate-binding domain-containing protein [Opitutaceae bacterium]|jgi:LacI family transcriptional regulator|nr:substrate-binding domain-containing protein [Opitutaceae bacterium]
MKDSGKLVSTLREVVQAKAPNTRLPSIRALMKRHGASLYAVNLALRRLADEELVDVRHGSGIYVRARKGGRYIEFHRPLYPSSNTDIKELSLSRAVSALGWHLLVRHHGANGGDQDDLMNPIASAHVVVPPLLDISPTFRDQVLRQRAPVVLAFGSNMGQLPFDHIMGNDHQYFSSMVKHFVQSGHQRIAFLQNEPPCSSGASRSYRSELYTDIMRLLDLPVNIIDCGTRSGENSMLKAYEGLSRHLSGQRGSRPGFTALIVGSAAGVPGVLRAMHEAGLSVPGDCSVGSLGMEPENSLRVPSVTEVGVADDQWGEGVVEVLQRRFASPDMAPMTLKLEPTLHVRESSAKLATIGGEKRSRGGRTKT